MSAGRSSQVGRRAKACPQRAVTSASRVVAPTSVKCGRFSLMERADGPFADDNIQGELLHGRIQDLLDHAAQAVDLVDEKDVAGTEAR